MVIHIRQFFTKIKASKVKKKEKETNIQTSMYFLDLNEIKRDHQQNKTIPNKKGENRSIRSNVNACSYMKCTVFILIIYTPPPLYFKRRLKKFA